MFNEAPPFDSIVLCLILDSRQNAALLDYVAGVIVLCLILDSRQNISVLISGLFPLYCALFWIQGKTQKEFDNLARNCTVPYFGFKAKPSVSMIPRYPYCTVPYFGFKAKQKQLY